MGSFCVAQFCKNGHLITMFAGTLGGGDARFCKRCGEETITHCPNCERPIRGPQRPLTSNSGRLYRYPNYCEECGYPYPWTERRIAAALELARQSSELTDEDNKALEEDITDVVRETPRSQVAAGRFRQAMSKAGKTTAEGVKSIITDILSETTKKMIWGP